MTFDPVKWNYVIHGSPAMRKAICEREPLYFAAFYFTEYFSYKIPDFHFDLYEDCKGLTNGNLDEAMWCIYREGAKTSIAKIALLIWAICFKKKKYIGWSSYDGDNAESALFDTTVALQSNKRIISDFGHLYYKKRAKDALTEAQMKRIKNFKTENGVRVTTFSTQESTRGRLTGADRLDLMIYDDFENNKTKDSSPVTQKVIENINEYRSGMPAYASVLYLCNYITDSGSVAHIMETLRGNNRARVRFVPVVDSRGNISWPDKYVKTDQEAHEINRTLTDPKKYKISLEARKASLSKDGLVYETEMMLNPAKSGDLFFDRDKVMAALNRAREPVSENAGFKIWETFNPKHRYGGGSDTSDGIGGDSNASAWINFSTTPNRLVGSFEDNMMSATTFAYELKREGGMFGLPYLLTELAVSGYATIAELLTAGYPQMYQREVKNKTTGRIQKEYGWKPTAGSVFQVMGEFKEAFESGELEILDAGLLTEMKFYTKMALRLTSREKGATRHYDKLRAAALAWEARKFAPLPQVEKDKKFKVPGMDQPYRP